MSLWKEKSCFSLLVDFGRWMKRGFIQWYEETGVGEGEYIYMRSHGCSHRTEMRKSLLAQSAVPFPICLSLNCRVTEMSLTFRKKQQNVTFYSTLILAFG